MEHVEHIDRLERELIATRSAAADMILDVVRAGSKTPGGLETVALDYDILAEGPDSQAVIAKLARTVAQRLRNV